jgi:hypothetical protein
VSDVPQLTKAQENALLFVAEQGGKVKNWRAITIATVRCLRDRYLIDDQNQMTQHGWLVLRDMINRKGERSSKLRERNEYLESEIRSVRHENERLRDKLWTIKEAFDVAIKSLVDAAKEAE